MATELPQETPTLSIAPNVAPTEFLDTFIREKEAAQFLGFSHRTIQDMRTTGSGPKFYRMGRSIRYRRRDLIQFAEDRVRLSTSQA